jgi:hypothetical protein
MYIKMNMSSFIHTYIPVKRYVNKRNIYLCTYIYIYIYIYIQTYKYIYIFMYVIIIIMYKINMIIKYIHMYVHLSRSSTICSEV